MYRIIPYQELFVHIPHSARGVSWLRFQDHPHLEGDGALGVEVHGVEVEVELMDLRAITKRR